MDYTFLADRIKKQLCELQPDQKPLCVIRGSGGFNNEPGESYIIPYSETIYLYDRKFNERDFTAKCVKIADISEFLFEHEPFSAELILKAGSQTVRLKISGAEIPNAELTLEHFDKCKAVEPASSEAPQSREQETENSDVDKVSPMLGLAAALMFVAAVDGKIAGEEQKYIERLCGLDEKLYLKAYEYYQNNTFEELLKSLELDNQQKMCYLANVIELAMSDGVFDSKEQKTIEEFTNSFGIDESKVRMIEDVLLMKNQLSVLE